MLKHSRWICCFIHQQDRHTTGHLPPQKDAQQDWFLLHGEENSFGTLLKFVRPIRSCDKDLNINVGQVYNVLVLIKEDGFWQKFISP